MCAAFFLISYVLRHGDWNPYVVPLYRNMAIFVELADIIVMFMFEIYKNVLKRGYSQARCRERELTWFK